MTNANTLHALALVLMSMGLPQQSAVPLSDVPIVSLCELRTHSQQYVGRTISMRVRVTAGRHVTGIWSPACPSQGADLHWQDSSPGITKLEELLRQAGMGDHPVIATLKGIWMGKQHTDSGFLPQPRTVFLMSDADDIGRSEKVERR